MNTLAKITLVAVALAAGVSSVNAADANDGTAPAGKHPRLRALKERRAAAGEKVARKLDLSADQISQLKARRAQTKDAIAAIRTDASLTPEQKKAKARETIQAARTEARGVLTPDQQAKAGHMRKQLRQFRGAGRK